MKATFSVQYVVYGPLAPGQHTRPVISSGQKIVLAADAPGVPAMVSAITSVLGAHPEAVVTGVQQQSVIDLES